MIKLPTEFKGRADQRGFSFKQLKRTGDIALFEKQEWIKHEKIWAEPTFEVVIVSKCEKRSFPDGRVADAHEAMPSPEKWGTEAWSCLTRERAYEKFGEVLENSLTQS